jgi:subtilisin family serine protease
VVVLVLVGSAAILLSWARPAPAAPAANAATVVAAGGATVTLLTGDRVLVGRVGGGREVVTVTPARRGGRHVAFATQRAGGDTYVISSDVAGLVPGVLDRALFDVSLLVRDGLDDHHAPSLRLLIQHANGQGTATLARAAGLQRTRELASIHTSAVRQPRPRADRLGGLLATAARASASRHHGGITPGPLAAGAGPLAGVRHIWLDRPVQAAELDANLTQIGAPAAWQAGLNGSGVTVAVLDSGIDATHPDLAGKVTDQANFSDTPDTGDHLGHGTHVAATIAGSGAAAGGQRKGVAFDAALLNAKVLDDTGSGFESGVIAGMEWAAAHHARVANLSLGGDPSDGSDPLSQALDRLTTTTGTLFVVAAGNGGPDPQTISSPGAADAALTVGAVDPHAQLAGFSSRGPRQSDYAIKPDLTAPGVGIVAARAAGTSWGEVVDERYTRASGTSMATPHVVGAAAVLAQQHPDWAPARLKAILEDTATVLPALSAYQQGGGRLDLAHATTQQVISEQANLDFGYFRYPQRDTRPAARRLTLANTGTAQTTVDLALSLALRQQDGQAAPAGAAWLSPTRLTLAPGQSATATLTVDPSQLAPGLYGGAVTVAPAGGQPALHVPVGFYQEPERYDLRVAAMDRAGNPAEHASLGVVNVDDAQRFLQFVGDLQGEQVLRVPPGTYSIHAMVMTPTADDGWVPALLAAPQVEVRADTTVTLDARTTVRTSAAVAGEQTKPDDWLYADMVRQDATGGGKLEFPILFLGLPPEGIYVQPIPPVTKGKLEVSLRWRLLPASAAGPGTSPHLYDLLLAGTDFPPGGAYVLSRPERARLARIDGAYRAPGAASTGEESRAGFTPLADISVTVGTPMPLPARRVDYLTTCPVRWAQVVALVRLPDGDPAALLLDRFPRSYRPAEQARQTWGAAPLHPALVVEQPDPRLGPGLLFTAADFTDAEQHHGTTLGFGFASGVTQALRLYRDSQPLDTNTETGSDVFVPDQDLRPGAYRVERDLQIPTGLMPLSGQNHTAWEFTIPPPGGSVTVPPVLNLAYQVRLDPTNIATAGQPLTLTLQAQRLTGAPPSQVTQARLWYSIDDGDHWHQLRLAPASPGQFLAVIPADQLGPGTTVSLRASASDRSGSSVDQTVLHAIPVRP